MYTLLDQIDRENSWSKVQQRLEQLRDYLQELGPADGIIAGLNVLVHGKNRSKPLIDLLKQEYEVLTSAPSNVLQLLCETMGILFSAYRNGYNFLRWLSEVFCDKSYTPDQQIWIWRIVATVMDVKYQETYKVYGTDVSEIILPALIVYLQTVPNDDLLEKVISILRILSKRYPEAIELQFEEVVDVLLGLVSTSRSRNVLIGEWIDDNSHYWSKHLVYGIQILMDCNTVLQDEFGIQCRPNGSTYQPVVKETSMTDNALCLTTRYELILRSLFNGCWGYLVGNIVLHEQLLHVIRWNIEIGNLVILKISSPAWLRSFYCSLNITLRGGPTTVIKSCLDKFLEKHFEMAKRSYEEKKDVSGINEWLEVFQLLFPQNPTVLPETISQLFIHPKKSFLMRVYRLQVCNKPNFLERLAETTSHLFPIATCDEWLDELDYLMNLESVKGGSVVLGEEYGSIKLKPAQLARLIDFTLQCLKTSTSPHEKERNVQIFKALTRLHQKLAGMIEIHGSFRKMALESSLLISLLRIGEISGFFFPKLNVGRYSIVDNLELIDYQLSLLKQWAIPNHFTNNTMGLLWLKSWVNSIKDRNVLDTLVGDSFVLSTVELILLRYLKKCSLEADPMLRVEVGEIWKLYLQHFGGNRRSESNTAMIIRFFLQRIHDVDKEVQRVFFDCLCLLDGFDTAVSIESLSTALKRDYVEEFKYQVMSSPSSGTFQAKQFRFMARFLGMGSYLQERESDMDVEVDFHEDSDWLRNLYFACQAEHVFSLMNTDPILLLVAQSSYECLMFWALWETARFFIITRLNTPFGTPLQSLEAIGKALDTYLKLFEVARKENVLQPQILQYMERLSLFLTMVDFLESQIIVASKGSTTTCPAPPKPSLIFFSSNSKVCQE
jgi:hypothetical protein